MPRVTPPQNSFNAGELSPRTLLRTDLDRYYKAVASLENLLPLVQGGVTRRPGTRFIAYTKTQDVQPVRLIPFEFNAEQAYILEFGQGYIRFFRGREQVLDGGTPFEITSPYTNFDPFQLRWAQSGDTIRFVHPNFPPQILKRFGDTNWTIEPIVFQGGPFLPINPTNTTILSDVSTGTVTLTASAPLFLAGHVGSLWRIGEPSGTISLATWTPGEAVTAITDQRQFNGRVYRAETTGTTGTVAPTHSVGDVSDGGVTWKFLHDGYGVVKIDAVNSTTEAIATVQDPGRIPSITVARGGPTVFWQEGAWSDVNGYPRAISIFEQRVVYADGLEPTLRYSKTGDFDNFSPPGLVEDTQDDDPIDGTLDSGQESQVHWMVSRDSLLVGTSGGEWSIRSSSGGPVTPTDIRARRTTGTRAGAIEALLVRASVLFLARGREKLHELIFDFESDNFETPDVTRIADHILTSGAVQMIYQQEPDSIIWGCLENGSLVSLSYDRTENVISWARHPMPGREVKSVMTIPGSQSAGTDQRDEVWLVVTDGTTRRVEVLEPVWRGTLYGDDLADAHFVDSGVRLDALPTTTVNGLDHLEGQEVNVFADGVDAGKQVVAGGSITLATPASKISAGLPIRYYLQSVKVEGGSPLGTAIGKKRRVSECMISLLDSCDVMIGADRAKLEPVKAYTNQTDLLTGDYRVTFPSTWQEDRDPRIYIESDSPCPATILAIAPRQEVSDA